MVKKVIVIASAVIAILYSLYQAGLTFDYAPDNSIAAYLTLIMTLLITLISSRIIFDIKQTKLLRITLIVFSILIALVFTLLVGFDLFKLISKLTHNDFIIIDLIGSIAIVIICLTYIRRALWPAKEKNSE